MKISDYRYIRAWGQHCGWPDALITGTQIDALLDAAPLDTVMLSGGRWRTIRDIKHVRTRQVLEDLVRAPIVFPACPKPFKYGQSS